MGLFGGGKDIELFKHFNYELIRDVIDIEVGYHQLNSKDSKVNIYGEDTNKEFYDPILIPVLLERSDQEWTNEQSHTQNQTLDIYFLRDNLKDLNIKPKFGDIIEWNNQYFEINDIIENQYWRGTNPETTFGDDQFGMNVGITCKCNFVNLSRIRELLNFNPNNSLDY